ncbi:hypothetical protein KCP73_14465 [Salmonella enterica subsp. enterica]|nr:hypothetical protein KCP73_14465 [Salmonella enterica subsp. enterica]
MPWSGFGWCAGVRCALTLTVALSVRLSRLEDAGYITCAVKARQREGPPATK